MEQARTTVELGRVEKKLSRWRQRHGGRGRPIPRELWAAAAEVAAVAGVKVTARVLGIDRERLARRVRESSSGACAVVAQPAPTRVAAASPAFVEVDAQRVLSCGKSRSPVSASKLPARRLQAMTSHVRQPVSKRGRKPGPADLAAYGQMFSVLLHPIPVLVNEACFREGLNQLAIYEVLSQLCVAAELLEATILGTRYRLPTADLVDPAVAIATELDCAGWLCHLA